MSSLSQTGARPASPRLVLIIVCAGVVLASLDLFIVNVALPQIGHDFHLGGRALGDLSWVLNAYAIVYAACLVLFGRLAERVRRDRAFLAGVALFLIGSAACGAANSLVALVVFRIIQAMGAALLTPTSLSLVLASFPPDRRAGAVRAWTAVGGLAAALGPVVGGLLVAASWRWVFLVNLPVGLVALAVGWRRLPVVPGHPVPAPDALGAVLITGGVGALVLGLVEGGSWGWGDARTLAALLGAIVALTAFAAHTAWHRSPLVDPSLLRLRPFTGSSVVSLLFSVAFGAMLLSRVLWSQEVWHWSALETGLSIAPGPLMVPLFAFTITGRLNERFGPGRVIAAGSTIFAAGIAWWSLAATIAPHYVREALGGMLLTGIGVGLTLPTMMATGAASLPAHSLATGSAVVNMFRQIGLAIGVAVFIAVLGTPANGPATLSAYQSGWWTLVAFSIASALAGLVLLRRPQAGRATAAPPVTAAAG